MIEVSDWIGPCYSLRVLKGALSGDTIKTEAPCRENDPSWLIGRSYRKDPSQAMMASPYERIILKRRNHYSFIELMYKTFVRLAILML